MQARLVFVPIAVLIASGCSQQSDDHIFTLYSNAASDSSYRFHVATFDKDSQIANQAWQEATGKDNQWNCDKAARLFKEEWDQTIKGQEQVKYWCEKGRFRK